MLKQALLRRKKEKNFDCHIQNIWMMGFFELRTKQGSNIVRNLYFFFVGTKIIITHGFRKKTQKTPPEEIERAKKYRKDYLARNPQKEEKK